MIVNYRDNILYYSDKIDRYSLLFEAGQGVFAETHLDISVASSLFSARLLT